MFACFVLLCFSEARERENVSSLVTELSYPDTAAASGLCHMESLSACGMEPRLERGNSKGWRERAVQAQVTPAPVPTPTPVAPGLALGCLPLLLLPLVL